MWIAKTITIALLVAVLFHCQWSLDPPGQSAEIFSTPFFLLFPC